MREFRVSKQGKEGCYNTVSAAVEGIQKWDRELQKCGSEDQDVALILVEPGIYEEVVELRRSNVTIKGTGSPEETIIQYGNYANMIMEDGGKRGTFRSYVMFLDGDHVTLENLTIRNTAFPRKQVGQALALYADGDGFLARNCHLESFQDTLFTGPLPPTPMSPGGFIGPKEHDERKLGRHIYDKCVIKGDVDFIFGSAMALFQECEIVSRNGLTPADQAPETGILGYVAAASTPEGCPVGYAFYKCRFTAERCPAGSVFLGRPWREYAQTELIQCELGEHIHPQGFHDWKKTQAHETIRYGEYQCHGPGAGRLGRADYARQLDEARAREILRFFSSI